MYPNGTGLILDSTYKVRQEISNNVGDQSMDLHELNIIDDGKTALMVTHRNRSIQIPSSATPGRLRPQNVNDSGFQEVALSTGRTNFEWWPMDHIDPLENVFPAPLDNSADYAWDFLWVCPEYFPAMA